MKKLISIVSPLYNEEGNVDELYRRIRDLMASEKKYDFEIIAVEHGSSDKTFEKLLAIRKRDKRLKILQLSKNFGTADAGISAGLAMARGDAAIIIMADLQEQPRLIAKLLRKWELGFDIVNGIVKKRPDVSYFRKLSSVLFYKIINKLTEELFPENVSDFRLIDKKVYEIINSMPERNRFLRGLITWTGFKQAGIPFERSPRFAGKSKADFLVALKVAANGIFSFSYAPLKFVTILGFILSTISFAMIIYQVSLFIIYGRGTPGISTIVILVSFLFSMLFLILGTIGEYLARIYDEVKRRPNYIVMNKFGFEKDNHRK